MRVIVVHGSLSVIGGAELVCLKYLDVLRGMLKCPIVLYTLDRHVNLRGLALRYGLLRLGDIQTASASIARQIPTSLPLMRIALLQREVRSFLTDGDVVLSTYNEGYFGRPSYNYIHHPLYAESQILEKYDIVPKADPSLSRNVYRWMCRRVSGISPAHIRYSYNVTNSHFMAGVVNEAYGVGAEILYPSLTTGQRLAIHDRDEDLLCCVARFARDKNLLWLIDAIKEVIKERPSTRLVICGRIVDAEYYSKLQESVWGWPNIRLLPDASDEERDELLRRASIFVNPKRFEHFGISILEAAQSGCTPMVHAGGGASEIVPQKELQFEDRKDLVSKLLTLLENPDRQRLLREEVGGFTSTFSTKRFEKEIIRSLRSFLSSYNDTSKN